MTLQFYVTEKLGPKQSLTPDGFLLVTGTPIARTGAMVYGPGETPVRPGPDGLVRIERGADEVFRPETLASCNGKPITNEHPDGNVSPGNWRDLAVGTVLNPRRGNGDERDFLIADLLITDEDAINEVRDGKREVSLGYEAGYNEIEPGLGVQSNIIINHLALVDKGRCGPRCAIGDRKTVEEERPMGRRTVLDRLRRAWKYKDEETFNEELDRLDGDQKDGAGSDVVGSAPAGSASGEHHVHVHLPNGSGGNAPVRAAGEDEEEPDGDEAGGAGGDRVAALEARIASLEDLIREMLDAMAGGGEEDGGEEADVDEGDEGEAPEPDETKDEAEDIPEEPEEDMTEDGCKGTKDRAAKTKDSANLRDEFQDTVALAEVLAPGIQVPTFDSAAPSKRTTDTMCALRRKALERAYEAPENRALIENVMGGKPLEASRMTCDAIATVFRASAALKRAANNANGSGRATNDVNATGIIRSPADYNAMLRARRAAGKL